MERVGALINKLKEQYEQRVDKNSLLVTAQMLLSELQIAEQNQTVEKRKISVIVPKVKPIVRDINEEVKQEPLIPKLPEEKIAAPVQVKEEPAPLQQFPQREAPVTQPGPQIITPSIVEDLMKYARQTPQTVPHESPKPPAQPEELPNAWLFNTPAEVPTLTHQKEVYELNDVHINEESLNDKFKEDRVEVAATLHDSPVRDLRKAIGINDRYRFINELFRGDETMYERSIKTINGFNILPEAEYWIQRELKVKLGWPEDNEAVKLFDQTVRRRFS